MNKICSARCFLTILGSIATAAVALAMSAPGLHAQAPSPYGPPNPAPTAAYLGWDPDPVLDGWEVHREVFAALDPFRVSIP